MLPRGALCVGVVQESTNNASFRFFAVQKGCVSKRVPGRKKTGIYFRKPQVRNSPRYLYYSKRGMGIHCSRLNLDSGLFRVVLYRSSIQARDREKTGMTVLEVVFDERRCALMRVLFKRFVFRNRVS